MIHLVQASVLVLHNEGATATDASIHVLSISHLLSVPNSLSILLIIFLRFVHFVNGVSVSWILVVLASMAWMVVCSRYWTTSSHTFEHVLWRGPHGSGACIHLLKLFHILRHFRLVLHRNICIVLIVLDSSIWVFSLSKPLIGCWSHFYWWVLDERWIWSNTTEVELLVYYHWSL